MEQLETIQKLFELGYITVDEYEKRKTQIIDSLTNTRIFSSSRHSPEERHELASSISKLEHKHIEYIVHILKAKSPNSFSQSPTGLYSFYIDEFDDGTFAEVKKFVNSCIEQSSAKSGFSIGPGSSLPYPGVKRRRELTECYEDDGDLIQTAVMESGVPEAGISEAGSSSSTTVIKRQPSKEEPIWDAPKRRRENTECKEAESESLLSLPLLTADPEINLRGSMELDDADFALDHLMVLEPDIPPFLDENPNTFNTFSDIDPFTYEQIAALLQDPAMGPVVDYPDPMLTLPVTPTIEPSFEPLDFQLLSSPPPTPTPDAKPESKKIKIKIQIYQVEKDGEDSKKPWRCDSPGCGKTFSDSSNLLKHIRTHTGEKPYSCTECSKGFSHSSSLKEHMNTHQDAKPFVCAHPGCGKSFAQGSNLRRHQRIHTGAKPYTCEVCGKDFNQSSNHKQHLSKVHGVTKTTRKTPVKKES